MFKKRGTIANRASKRRETQIIQEGVKATIETTDTPSTQSPPVLKEAPISVDVPKSNKASKNDALHQTRLLDEELNNDLAVTRPKTRFGPKSAASNIRSSTAVDYQPDVCKEYKQTGYCGYGDSCKFLHAREDYAAGWQLDQQWEADQTKAKAKAEPELITKPKSVPPEDQKCAFCKKPPTDRIKLKCDHVYCEQCFLELAKKSPKCITCKAPHNGAATPF